MRLLGRQAAPLYKYLYYTTAVAALALLLTSHPRTIDMIWRSVPSLDEFAPNLNGTYVLQTSSNWLVKRNSVEEGNGRARTGSSETQPLLRSSGYLRIQQGLFILQISYEPMDVTPSRSNSEVVASTLRRRADGSYELWYSYEALVRDPLPTDEQSYLGAGVFRFATRNGQVCLMEGSYWTNRAWRQGWNTAGIAVAENDCGRPGSLLAGTVPY